MNDTPVQAPTTAIVAAECPRCRRVEQIAVHVGVVLTEADDDQPALKVRLRGKPVTHLCRTAGESHLFTVQDEAQ